MTKLDGSVRRNSGKAIGSIIIENGRTIVTEWSFSNKGDDTGWHIHQFDYVVVPMFTGELLIDTGDQRVISSLQKGIPYFRQKGVEHNVINANDFSCKFIEIEFLPIK